MEHQTDMADHHLLQPLQDFLSETAPRPRFGLSIQDFWDPQCYTVEYLHEASWRSKETDHQEKSESQ